MARLAQVQEQYEYKPTGGVISAEAEATYTRQVTDSIKGALSSWGNYALKEKQKEDKRLEDEILTKGAQDGSLAVTEGQFLADHREGDDLYTTAYNKAQDARIAANIRVNTRERIAEIASQYATDKDGFKGAMDGLYEGMSEEMKLNDYGKTILQDALSVENERYLPQIVKNNYTKLKQETQAAFLADQQSLATQTLNAVRNGDDEVAATYSEQIIQNFELGVEQGVYTKEDKDAFVKSFNLEVQEQMVTGEVERALKLNTSEGIKTAVSIVDSWRTQAGKDGEYTPDELDSIRDKNNRLIKTKITALKAQNKEALKLNLAKLTVQAYSRANAPMDYKDKDSKAAVNILFDSTIAPKDPVTGAKVGFNFNNPEQREVALKFAYATSIVPEQLKSNVRTSLYSNNPEQAQLGVEILNRIVEERPEFMGQFGEKDIAYAKKVNALTTAGLDVATAIVQTKEFYSMDYQERQKLAIADIGDTKKFNKLVQSSADDFVDENFGGWFSSPDSPNALKRDYDRLLKHNLAMTDDLDAAKDLTAKTLKNKWSVTYINGEQEVVPYAPEKVLANSKEEVEYITNDANKTRKEVIQSVRAGTFGYDPDVKVKFLPDANTYRGDKPKWSVWYQRDSGVWERYIDEDGTPMYWSVQYEDTPEYSDFQKSKTDSVKNAQDKEKQLEQVDKMLKTQSRSLFY